MTRTVRRFVIGLLVLALLTPIGLWLPELYKAGAAWGEWGSDELEEMVGYVPKGLQALGNIWTKALFPAYGVSGWTSPFLTTLGYILSALLGMAIVAGLSYLFGKLLASKENKGGESLEELKENEKRR